MKISLVFFDSLSNSAKGTARGLIVFLLLVFVNIIWFSITKKMYIPSFQNIPTIRLWIAGILSTILVSSAISVIDIRDADDWSIVITYCMLVGLVVYGVTNLCMTATSVNWSYCSALIDTTWGIFSTALVGFILFKIVERNMCLRFD